MVSNPLSVAEQLHRLESAIETVVRGKRDVIRLALVTLVADGHLLIEDVPGVGKTTLARALSRALDCSFQRIQFTSDLLPSDVLGLSVYDQPTGRFEFRQGPIFANVVLADEINRTTPKTQSCLLEAMAEGRVTIENQTFDLPRPFIVLATQNPVEHHGTYPLPESQLDRFTMRLSMGYPAAADERQILLGKARRDPLLELRPVLSGGDVLALQEQARNARMDDALVDYLLRIVNATRTSELLEMGVSPRGSLALFRAAQAQALFEGRDYCLPDDIKRLAVPVLSHRIIVNPRYASGARETDDANAALEDILKTVAVPV
ncbi:MAG: ATPase [Chloracidobacterium sp. CP2_5A]|nr:MAG: ATPase [Chloracidobacterium sp. CP2_5A]